MKAAIIFLILLIQVLPASAAASSPEGVAGTAHIAGLYSNLESFDVTLYSDKPYENLTLELTLLKPVANYEEVLARKVIPVDSLPANTELTKVGSWDSRSAQSGAYSIRASLIENGRAISESKYNFAYGDNSVSKIRVDDLVPDSKGINVVLSPVKPVLFDIEYMLVDGSDVVYSTKANSLSLTSVPENFSAAWGTLLKNNREYQGRVKIRIYSPEDETFVSTRTFIARDNAEITDIYKDETGASATVYGRSQVPFEGNLDFKVFNLNDNSAEGSSEPVDSIREKVPVLMNGDDETVEVAWKQRLQTGVYKLEIELLGNSGQVIEHRETIIESNLSPYSNLSAANNSTSETNASSGKSTPGFSTVSLISGLIAISVVLRKKG
ncbi:MAG: hypothetical protein QG646_4236 [Euryarchaeota archaeon]|nr:hypothetical protein [Euryarchaeota archaeon]